MVGDFGGRGSGCLADPTLSCRDVCTARESQERATGRLPVHRYIPTCSGLGRPVQFSRVKHGPIGGHLDRATQEAVRRTASPADPATLAFKLAPGT